ncbi:hypothetical protein [Eoetvoesiella caeni]|uniref:hypothetical protein n=1 Tax=Eoetvoesiella caeni TaxID=645616 RepID=UPI0014758D45|nr:hypothetical protein [Eoetvoesiella caeni]MCI2807250.1 hypothetical protein [Eoetvoesiella caeni]NYT53354.1 hypothetical protein [Eoetvoesiella caeni]
MSPKSPRSNSFDDCTVSGNQPSLFGQHCTCRSFSSVIALNPDLCSINLNGIASALGNNAMATVTPLIEGASRGHRSAVQDHLAGGKARLIIALYEYAETALTFRSDICRADYLTATR